MRRRIAVAATAALLLALVGPAASLAGTASLTIDFADLDVPGGDPTAGFAYEAAPGETNDVSLTGSGRTVELSDAGAPVLLTPLPALPAYSGSSCAVVTAASVRCSVSSDVAFAGRGSVALGDGNDRAIVNGSADGGEGDDQLTGGAKDDSFSPGPGDDRIDGRGGRDIVDYVVDGPVRVDLGAGTGSAADGEDELVSIEGARTGGATPGPAVLIGNDRANFFVGGDAGNRIAGRGGRDDLSGGDGADQLDGGAGNDFLTGNGGRDRMAGGPGSDTILAADFGRGERDRISAGSGNDTIDARDKARDVIDCGAGRYTVTADRVDVLHGCERRKVR